jgi:hypothetical protein
MKRPPGSTEAGSDDTGPSENPRDARPLRPSALPRAWPGARLGAWFSRKSRPARVAAALGLVAALGFGAFYLGGSGEGDYFPLQAGRSWTYTMHVDVHGADPETFKSVAVNLSQETVDGARATPRLYHDGRVLYYRRDGGGIRAVAFHEPGGPPQPAAAGQYVLKFPVEPGTAWRTPSHTSLLTQRLLYRKVMAVAIPIDIDHAIAAVDETVTVPAGRFRHCVHVKGTAKTTVNALDSTRILPVSVEVEDWFAPGVGLVKSVRSEIAGAERTGNARMVMELEAFR